MEQYRERRNSMIEIGEGNVKGNYEKYREREMERERERYRERKVRGNMKYIVRGKLERIINTRTR